MFILTVRSHKIRFACILAASAALLFVTAFVYPKPQHAIPASKNDPQGRAAVTAKDLKGISTNEDRVRLLRLYGWEVDPEPKEIAEVTVPDLFDKVYEDYNTMQKKDGFDLKKVAGKQVKRYVYLVLNAQYDGTVLAELLIRNDRVVGGDVCSARIDGFVHPLTREDGFLKGESGGS
ncbi:MAG: DUF4830 domain-containing protein [Clostridia bacterium]|nr:DUF4830 domain-containing protein [Clostridia bacterium]